MATGVQVWSEVPVTNATVDSNINWAEGMAPSQVNDSARAMMASVAKWRDDNTGVLVTSGTTTALTLATNQVESALTTGFTVKATLGTAVASAATLAVDGLTATNIFTTMSTASLVSTGALAINQIVSFMYSTGVSTAGNSINGWVVSAAPPTASGITALTNVTATVTSTASIPISTAAFTDLVTVNAGSTGVWFASGNVTVLSTFGGANLGAKLWDGTTVMDTAFVTTPGVALPTEVHLSGIITNPAGNIKISAQGLQAVAYSAIPKDTTLGVITQNLTISAFRIG